jgi:hypothetical protein
VAEFVYVLCFLTSAAAAFLLLRAFGRTGGRILLWSGLCFSGLALNNALLFIDLVLVPDTDLGLFRSLTALAAVSLLVYGLIWDAE